SAQPRGGPPGGRPGPGRRARSSGDPRGDHRRIDDRGRRLSVAKSLTVAAAGGLLVLASPAALAQDPYGPGVAPFGGGMPTGPQQAPPSSPGPSDEDMPETHAAPTGDESLLPT